MEENCHLKHKLWEQSPHVIVLLFYYRHTIWLKIYAEQKHYLNQTTNIRNMFLFLSPQN